MLLSEPLTPNRKLYALLGELLHKKEPETYAKLIQFIPNKAADQDKITNDFISFCGVQGINPDDHRGNLYKHSKTEQKLLFIAVVIVKYGIYSKNISKYITSALNQNKTLTCRMIKEADVRYRCHKDFKSQVDNIVIKTAGWRSGISPG